MVTSHAQHTSPLAVSALLAAGLLWGLTWIPLKYFATQGLTGITMTLCTYGVVGIVAVPLILRQRTQWRSQSGLLLLMGFTGAIGNLCFVTALSMGEVARAMLLFYLLPIWGVMGGRVFFGESLTTSRVAAVVMALCGAILVLGGPQMLLAKPSLLDILPIASGFFYTAQNLASRAADRTPMLSKTLSPFVGCTIVASLAFAFSGHQFVPLSATLATQLMAFAFLWLILAMFATMYGVTHMEAGRASVLVIFELVVAVVSAMLIAGERLDAMGWAGALLITGAALLEARASTTVPKARLP